MQRELLRGVPDPVVGAGLAEVVAGCITGCMLARSTTPAANASSKITTPGPSASARISSDCSVRRSAAPTVAAA
jgi:hypothetical protein